ncbi:hypothetical protein [Sediminitomix flava]|uniref:Uncharacterized protein n=1 Tax=Sediminitomix flava TaxID=379075 RepID=A0A315ZA26_SEDFL|nr:hypothetical protein [Sediminitomix flava]PWJ42029.1 hypothetical protein BC781_103279 [Sediminitomix flava]
MRYDKRIDQDIVDYNQESNQIMVVASDLKDAMFAASEYLKYHFKLEAKFDEGKSFGPFEFTDENDKSVDDVYLLYLK